MHLTLNPEGIKVWILVPAAGDQIHSTFATKLMLLMGLLRTHKIDGEVRFMPGDSLVTRARNNLADIFLSSSTDDDRHFSLWLDCDILFDPESVLQMISLNLDFVSAPYTRKGLHMDRIKAAAEEGWPSEKLTSCAGTPNVNWLVGPISLSEPMPVLEAGSGFWLVKRKVFRMISEAFGDDYVEQIDGKSYYITGIKYHRTAEETAHYGRNFAYDFFKVGVWQQTREYLSEDWYLCRIWRKLGGVVWCCFWINTIHIGDYLYPMNMSAISELLEKTGGYINAETRILLKPTLHEQGGLTEHDLVKVREESKNVQAPATQSGTTRPPQSESQGELGEVQAGSPAVSPQPGGTVNRESSALSAFLDSFPTRRGGIPVV